MVGSILDPGPFFPGIKGAGGPGWWPGGPGFQGYVFDFFHIFSVDSPTFLLSKLGSTTSQLLAVKFLWPQM